MTERREEIRTTLARIDERVAGVSRQLTAITDELGRIEQAVDANTIRSLANEIASSRNSETIRWVQRTVLGFVIVSVLTAMWAASGI